MTMPASLKKFLLYFAALLVVGTAILARAEVPPVVLDDQKTAVPAWPHVTLLLETERELAVRDVAARAGDFQPPPNHYAALGVKPHGVWLRVPFTLAAGADSAWIAELAYAPLQKVDTYVFEADKLVHEAKLGSLRPLTHRPLASRTAAVPLTLKPATPYVFYARVETRGSLILPLALKKPAVFHTDAINEHMLQGVLLGIAFCLLIYSVFQGLIARDVFFLSYALLVAGGIGTALLQTGIGAQYIWGGATWIETHIAGLSSLAALGGTFIFLEVALREPAIGKPAKLNYATLMKGGAALVLVLSFAFALDLIGLAGLAPFMMILGPLPTILSLPRLIRRVRNRDAVGIYLMIAFSAYMMGAAVTTALVRGDMPANFWSMHAFQFASTIDILAFMYVLTASTRASQLAAYRARRERDAMHSLAHTDPLTGLVNRRGLNSALAQTLAHTTATQMAAVYAIDVDGFKPINDRFGHDVGDELLIAIAARLKHHVRAHDVVSRVGGDEFIIVASNLVSEQFAETLGTTLLHAFDEPIAIANEKIVIGLTIGYAVIPVDATDAAVALKLADTAMFAGKQAGKRFLRRAVSLNAAAQKRMAQVSAANLRANN